MKLKDTFTPGSWRANIAADSLRVPDGVCSADGLHVCDVASYGASPSTRHANARLIASAPELAEALEMALESLDETNVPEEWDCRPKIRAALAKAVSSESPSHPPAYLVAVCGEYSGPGQ